MLTMNSRIYLWDWDEIFGGNEYKYNYELVEPKTKILSKR